MISAWWLLLIIPASYIVGYLSCGFMMGSKEYTSNDSDKK